MRGRIISREKSADMVAKFFLRREQFFTSQKLSELSTLDIVQQFWRRITKRVGLISSNSLIISDCLPFGTPQAKDS
jgi:hypothetical protein